MARDWLTNDFELHCHDTETTKNSQIGKNSMHVEQHILSLTQHQRILYLNVTQFLAWVGQQCIRDVVGSENGETCS